MATDIILLTFQSTYCLLIIKVLSHKRHVRINDCFLVLFSGVSTGLLHPHIGIFVSPILVSFLCYYSYKVHEYNLSKSIFLSTLTLLIAIFFDHAASIILSVILGETGFDNEDLLFIHLLISLVLTILFTLFFTKLTKKIRAKINQNKQFPTLLAIINTLILFSFYGSIILSTYLGNEIELITLNFIFLTIYLVIGLIIFYFYAKTLREKMKMGLERQEKEYYFAQNELMVETVETVKSIRHDMKLHLATLENYIKDNPEEALAYVNHLLGDIGKSEVYSDTGNVALDSIINFKLKSVKDADIATRLDVFAPAVIGIETSDIVIIVGNLLDNAMEAVAKVDDKFINIHIAYQLGNLLIKVENPFDGVVKKDKSGDLVTIKSGDGHGFGLKNVFKSAEKYYGSVDITHEGNIFTAKVLLYAQEN